MDLLDSVLDGAQDPPALRARHRTRLDDLDEITFLGRVVLVVRLVLHAAGDELVEAAVADAADDRDDGRLVHLRGRDGARDRAARSALVRALGGFSGHDYSAFFFEVFLVVFFA